MANVLVIDGNSKTKEVVASYLNEFEGVSCVSVFDDFSQIPKDFDYKNLDILIFDIAFDKFDEIFEEIKMIKTKNQNISLIAASYEINSELVIKTLKNDVNEFILKPFIKNILEATIKKILEKRKDKLIKSGRVLCVFSNKGGVGKTSLATNLAYNIAETTNEETCIFDLSFNQDDAMTFLNLESKFDINYILKSLERSDKNFTLSLMPKYRDSKLYALASGKNVEIMQKLSISDIVKIINYLKTIFSYVIIDTASIIGETTVSIMNESDIILLLGLANLSSIRSCQKCYELFEKIGYNNEKTKLIVNRYIENSEIKIKDIEDTLNKEVFYKIPNNYLALIDAINIGQTVRETNPQSNIAKAYKGLAREILNLDFLNLNDANGKIKNYGVYNLLRRMGE